ncbi:uncharacterized protein LOC112563236 [Pomacea canaliculata]|uniref:uncharacterized protein LOC112563236 n=1 Tax=Pomacea canaliculata TaxID=400727 RepID=UPI000D72A90D|nr:uncharacterized protein LOC112563236 [Pomacea canaliculata]
MLSFFLIFFVGLVSESWCLNSNCKSSQLSCTVAKAVSISVAENACRYTQTYASCIDSILWSTTACDELSSLVLRSTTYTDVANTKAWNKCDIEISDDFVLNDCENQKANCSKLTEYPFTEGDIYKKCMYLETFRGCFEGATPACEDRIDIARLVNMELTRLQHNSTCVGLMYPITTTPTPTPRPRPTTVKSQTATAAPPSGVKPNIDNTKFVDIYIFNGSSKSVVSATSTIVLTLVLYVWTRM